jgi:hypothetical protein
VYRVPITIGGWKKRTLDLCQLHHDELIQPVLDALDRFGAIPKKDAKAEQPGGWTRASWMRKIGPFKCRMPGCVAPVLKDGEVFNRHLINLHGGVTFQEYVKTYGGEPATPEEVAEPVTIECEVEGCDAGPDGGPMVYSTAFGNRWPHHAMTSHMRGRHGLIWKPGGIGVIGKVGE